MSEVWPFDVKSKMYYAAQDSIRPFKCLLLMPFEQRFNWVAETIRSMVQEEVIKYLGQLPEIKRLDWVTSSKVIHEEIWTEIYEADLIFCDITGYNPNVMFECGICAAWKDKDSVVFIKDATVEQKPAFNIAPIRYTEYCSTRDGIELFREKVRTHSQNTLIRYPDFQGSAPEIKLPLEINFEGNRDDNRIYTPPFAHRRVIDGGLEFGSMSVFSHSWATVGKTKFHNFDLEFSARFSPVPPLHDGPAFIGVRLRSQHWSSPFGHILYLNRNGEIVIDEPNEDPPKFYEANKLRGETPINLASEHYFHIVFNESILSVELDDFFRTFQVAQMKRVLGPGLIRFQAFGSWMIIKCLRITEA
ncbi:hypothetical protein FJZ31_36715 [Candidatus Poribacteria bacterium]|nr:hypothetical protein [Candidatus Poribacteria bacterium]